jgi:hypothetical protein
MNHPQQKVKLHKALSLLFFICFSCLSDQKNESLTESTVENGIIDFKSFDSNKFDVLTKLDTNKYYEMVADRDLNLLNYDNLYYSILMCEKGNNKVACMDCYRILSGEINPSDHNFNPTIYKKLSCYFLRKAMLLGDRSAIFLFKENYPRGISDSAFHLNLEADFKSN